MMVMAVSAGIAIAIWYVLTVAASISEVARLVTDLGMTLSCPRTGFGRDETLTLLLIEISQPASAAVINSGSHKGSGS